MNEFVSHIGKKISFYFAFKIKIIINKHNKIKLPYGLN
jgi:hypothetical protein